MTDFYRLDTRDGTSQSERFPDALESGYFSVDERKEHDLLLVGARLATNIKYFSSDNELAGNWSDLFAKEPAFVLAEIASLNLDRLRAEYELIESGKSLVKCGLFIERLAFKIDRWTRVLSRSPILETQRLNRELEGLINHSLAKCVLDVHAVLHTRTSATDALLHRLNERLNQYGRVWGFKHDFVQGAYVHSDKRDEVRVESLDEIRQVMNSGFDLFLGTLNYLKPMVTRLVDKDLNTGDLEPAVALFVSFVRLFARAQRKLNQFSNKRLEFYYKKVLKMQPALHQPDKVNLALELNAGYQEQLIKKGTRFPAGKDSSDHDVYFESDSDVWLTDAKVADLKSLYMEKDSLVYPANQYDFVTQADALALAPNDLGKNGVSMFSGTHLSSANLGLALSSPVFNLSEGERKITIDVECKLPEENACEDGQEPPLDYFLRDNLSDFNRYLCQPFDISVTTENGWFTVPDYRVTSLSDSDSVSNYGLQVVINLGRDEPAIVPYSELLHGPGYATQSPVLRLQLRSDGIFFAYSPFANLEMQRMHIRTDVRDCRNLTLYNSDGQLDSSKPFEAFGGFPTRDSYMVVGHYEAVSKNLSKAVLNIQWDGLPRSFGGFDEYYKEYNAGITNDDFVTTVSVLRNSKWVSSSRVGQRLFSAHPATGRLCESTRIDLLQDQNFSKLSDRLRSEDYQLDSRSTRGFFKLDLSQCEQAFGHSLYPQLLSYVLTENARKRLPLLLPIKPKLMKTPNLPYTPVIQRVSISYSASTNIELASLTAQRADGNDDGVFHIHPFGIRQLSAVDNAYPMTFVPTYVDSGYLFVGIKSRLNPGTVNLLFDFRNDRRQSLDVQSQLRVSYLQNNELRPLRADAVLSDSTENFSKAGIVTLDMPNDMNADNTVLPSGLYWLVFSFTEEAALLPQLHGIRTGGLQAVRVASDTQGEFQSVLSGTIKEMSPALPAVSSVTQLGDSFGGHLKETHASLTVRTAERLRHKNRASQPWDYERLILERFPQVAKVKCFANMSKKHTGPSPGEVLVVVVPRVERHSVGHSEHLLVDRRELISMKRFLNKHASSCARIQVQNPSYELVQIRCSVKFAPNVPRGRMIRELNGELSRFLSPWHEGGLGAQFSWCIRRKDIEAHIGALDYVEYITGFSMLHVSQGIDDKYCLRDTARPLSQHSHSSVHDEREFDEIHSRFPWSLALPNRDHFIHVLNEIDERPSVPSGVGELEIGSTLILDEAIPHG